MRCADSACLPSCSRRVHPAGQNHQHSLLSVRTIARHVQVHHIECVLLQAAFEAPQVGQQAHAAVLQQLGSRTPQLLNGRQVYEAISTIRLLPLSVDRYATCFWQLFLSLQ